MVEGDAPVGGGVWGGGGGGGGGVVRGFITGWGFVGGWLIRCPKYAKSP